MTTVVTGNGHPYVAREPVQQDADPAIVRMAPMLAEALAVWDLLGLEIGDLALVSGDCEFSQVAALAASWYGAHPVVRLSGKNESERGNVDALIKAGDQESATAELHTLFKRHRHVAAVELSGRRELVDLIFETVPMFARVLLAGTAGDTLTINFYVNVHRKGLQLHSGVVGRLGMVSRHAVSLQHRLDQAMRLLRDPSRAATLAAVVATGRG